MAHPVSQDAHGHGGEHHGSFWPLYLTIATTIMLLGAIWPVLFVPGLLALIGTVVGWIHEDVLELKGTPFATGKSEYFFGSIVLIMSEVVIFGLLFFFYFWSRSHADVWPAEQIAHLDLTVIVANTVILLTSGGTIHMAQHALEKGHMKKFRTWLGVTILLGVLFLMGQAYEYYELVHEGLTPMTSAYGTAFYSLTGTHGLHVLAGVGVLATIWGLSYTGFIRKERSSGVTGAFLYWHFVDVVWIAVVSIVYLRLI